MFKNNILLTDSYKPSHFLQLPPKTEFMFEYSESRGGVFDKTVFFGLQYFLKEYLSNPITKETITEAKELLTSHGVPFNEEGWNIILKEHGGRLPLEIEAIPEGTIVPNKNVLLTIKNTDPRLPWLPGYFETSILRAVWYGTTVATLSWHIKQEIKSALEDTADNLDGLPFKLHDFGARGVSSHESAMIGGAAHLVNFMGSDTLEGIKMLIDYYQATMPGFSIPAAEHSTITSWGKENELAAFANMLDQFPTGLVAVVSDSYDLWNAIDNYWGDVLRDRILARDGTLVIRPDSGDPAEVVLETLERLGEKFGYTWNSKGCRVLPPQVRIIQGDGVNYNSIKDILGRFRQFKWSADNLAFGMGGGLLQQLDRDTQKFATKASAARINGEWRDVYKDPITDPGKTSKKGLLTLDKVEGKFVTVPRSNIISGHLRTVYRNGKLLIDDNLDNIRRRAERSH